MGTRYQLTTMVAALALIFGGGCVTADAAKATVAKKPDVTQPGVLPPPQAMMPATGPAAGGAVVQAGGVQPAGPVAPGPVVPAAPAPVASTLARLTTRPEKKVPASEMAIVWKPQIAYLPDPSRNGAMGAGLVGQMFLFGGPKMEFALADGPLTVDLIDETPRPAGQPAATAERWQIDKATLRNLRITDETFGKCYALFLPWPAYKPDITKVRISVRYDPENSHTIFSPPSALSIDPSGPLGTPKPGDGPSSAVIAPGGRGAQQGFGPVPFAPSSVPFAPGPAIPLGGAAAGTIPLGGAMPNAAPPMFPLPAPVPSGAPVPLGGAASGGMMMPMAPGGAGPLPAGATMPMLPGGAGPLPPPSGGMMMPMAPVGAGPLVPAGPASFDPVNEPLQPLTITVGRPQ